jgi:DNA polymerase
MRLAHQRLPRLSPNERRIFELTIEANERGVEVDVPSLAPAQALFDQVSDKLTAEFTELTGANPNSSVKAAAALGLPDFTEDTVRRTLLNPDISPTTRRALEIRQLQAYSSLKKLEAFRVRTSGDGRLRGSMIYAGAERTTRWSAGGIQIQNFPSNVAKDMEWAFSALHADCLDLAAGDDVLGTLSGMLRGFFRGPFVVGDFRQVEPRVEAWLAKQFDMMNDFAAGKDLYKSMAATIHGVPIEAVTKLQRDIGKRAILGCGYGMGPDKFKFQMETMHGVKISDELAQRAVRAYRTEYPKIPKLWRALEQGMETAIRGKHKRIQAGPVEMGVTEIAGEPFAYIRLPSGRAIFYGWPDVSDGEITYFGRDNYSPGKHWGRVGTWGGKITENVVQAVCRDLLAHVVINMDAAGFPMAFTAHDELVSLGTDIEKFTKIFTQKPEWARTLALDVEVFTTGRYRK